MQNKNALNFNAQGDFELFSIIKKKTGLVSRVLYAFRRGNHLSSLPIAEQFKPCGSATKRLKSDGAPALVKGRKVLLRIGFTANLCYHRSWWALTPPFHPYRNVTAVYLCCTFPRVTPGGRYPLSCSVKPGLSSR